jgi:hypothetical protein
MGDVGREKRSMIFGLAGGSAIESLDPLTSFLAGVGGSMVGMKSGTGCLFGSWSEICIAVIWLRVSDCCPPATVAGGREIALVLVFDGLSGSTSPSSFIPFLTGVLTATAGFLGVTAALLTFLAAVEGGVTSS